MKFCCCTLPYTNPDCCKYCLNNQNAYNIEVSRNTNYEWAHDTKVHKNDKSPSIPFDPPV